MDPEVVRRLRVEVHRLRFKASNLRERGKPSMAAQEQEVADDLDALLAGWERRGEAQKEVLDLCDHCEAVKTPLSIAAVRTALKRQAMTPPPTQPILFFLVVIFLLGAVLTAWAGGLDRTMLCLILANQFRVEGGKP